MKSRLFSFVMVLALLSTFTLAPFSPALAKKSGSVSVPITYTDAVGTVFAGTYQITRFATQNGALVAVGTLTGTVTDASGNLLQTVNQALTLPVSLITATCDILHLELGPLDLTLLGLNVHLDKVVLDITATAGGGLLGDLLCSIANLLSNNSPLSALVRLLNNVLGALG
jgi:hypothetical protein